MVTLFGYGSLLSRRSLERTLGRPYNGPLVTHTIPGWRRTWDAAMDNENFFFAEQDGEKFYPDRILYLNVTPDPHVLLNGVLISIEESDLARFDKREWIYDRIEATPGVHLYVCKPEHCARNISNPRDAAIRRTYIRTVEDGISERDPSFRPVYERSTDPPPPELLIQDQSE